MRFILLGLLVFIQSFSFAKDTNGSFEANLYAKDSSGKDLLFIQKVEAKHGLEGEITYTGVYLDAKNSNSVAAKEILMLDKNGFKKYIIEHYQINQRWITDRFGDKIAFKRIYLSTGEVKKDTESMTDNFIVAPMAIDYLRTHWDELLAGETIKVRFGLPARRETIGIKFFFEKNVVIKGESAVEIIAKPSNFILALLVDPIKIYLRKKDKELLRFIGRTLPRIKDGDSWEELDVEIDYKSL